MRSLSCGTALALVAFAGQAEAKGAAWCQVNGAKYETYLSGIVEIDDGPDALRNFVSGPFGKGFQDYVRLAIDPRASSLDCMRQDSLFYARDYVDVLIAANPGFKFVKTGWRGNRQDAAADRRSRGGAGESRADVLRYRK